jgi:hypothetical protein
MPMGAAPGGGRLVTSWEGLPPATLIPVSVLALVLLM